MERFSGRRFAALLLALLLALSPVLPAAAAAVPPAQSVPFTEVTPPEDAAAPPPYHQLLGAAPQAMSDEPLRVIIELEEPSLLERGYDAADVADNADAMACNEELKQYQREVIAAIEAATGEPLDVVWRLTIVADLLSAWVQPAQADIIAAVPGVRSVQEDAVVVPLAEESGEEANNGGPGDGAGSIAEAGIEEVHDEEAGGGGADEEEPGGGPAVIAQSSAPATIAQIGVEPDYTGAGQRIAIIDTGTDEWHRSLNSGAWMNSLQQNAELTADPDTYLSSLQLLYEADIENIVKKDLLTITQPYPALLEGDAWKALAGHGDAVTADGRSLHKIAFGANYAAAGIDDCGNIAHSDEEHGSHVAGIAAANRYVPDESCWDPASGRITGTATYKNAVETVGMQGQAPDAQLLVMQVFGDGNSDESAYMAAIQDALVLGADTVNLSLGSNAPGETFALTPAFQGVLNRLVDSGTIVAAAQGNSGCWTSTNWPRDDAGLPVPPARDDAGPPELPCADDVVFDSGGTPASYDTFLAVAAADDTGGEARMAWFSSWGVPSTLELKPEITAPGTRIVSLNGAHNDIYDPDPQDALHGNYEEMSGTSMASPQIAGMAALVLERLKRNYPGWRPAKRRQVAQSLLMSTAVPMADPDGNYYPVLQQGAGLADVEKAVTADAYITMGEYSTLRSRTAADGKVKADLGAKEGGTFRFDFTIHDLSGAPHRYMVYTDLFTQALIPQDDGSAVLSTATAPLDWVIRYNGDEYEGGFLIEVLKDDSVTVEVEIEIDPSSVTAYPAGAYVEGYTKRDEQNARVK